jgi:histidine triad (HIT) family protein
MDPCSLCELVSGRADRWPIIEETALTVTILNGRQFEVGQCLVLPRRHAPTILDLTDEEAAAVMTAARRIAGVMVAAFEPDGVLLYQNNGTGSLQEVPHFHLHVVPRREGSEWGTGPPHLAQLEGRRPAHLDHAVVTEAKLLTAQQLRRGLGAPPPRP